MRSLTAALALFASLASAEAAPKVMTSIMPIHSIVSAVMGGTGSPELIFAGTVSEHSAALSPRQIADLGTADLVFMAGPTIEIRLGQLDKSEAVNGKAFVMLAETPGVTRLKIRAGGAWEPHDHDQEDGHGHAEGIATYNAHVWLSPTNAKAMAVEVARQLALADAANAAVYEANAGAFATAVDGAATGIATLLAPVRDKPFIVFHDAYPYFEEAFGLSAVGSIADAAGQSPSAKRLGEIRAKLAETQAVCVFREPQFDARFAETVTEGSSARIGMLDAMGANLSPGPEAYLQLLKNLAQSARNCLAGTS